MIVTEILDVHLEILNFLFVSGYSFEDFILNLLGVDHVLLGVDHRVGEFILTLATMNLQFSHFSHDLLVFDKRVGDLILTFATLNLQFNQFFHDWVIRRHCSSRHDTSRVIVVVVGGGDLLGRITRLRCSSFFSTELALRSSLFQQVHFTIFYRFFESDKSREELLVGGKCFSFGCGRTPFFVVQRTLEAFVLDDILHLVLFRIVILKHFVGVRHSKELERGPVSVRLLPRNQLIFRPLIRCYHLLVSSFCFFARYNNQ
mmetsp:Transcript_23421/g.23658  ORF Transcript_23421/g.23658 Transcript_23421/m.23658 type:complete len:259 (+) Transcript_23421:629-1405(+)